MDHFTTALELIGVLLLCAFAYAVWPPAALAAAGVAALAFAWRMED